MLQSQSPQQVVYHVSDVLFDAVIFRPRNTKSFHLEFAYPTKSALQAVWGILPESRIPDISLVHCNSLFFPDVFT
jgi:hypothetical protein